MDKAARVDALKQLLLKDVAYLCSRADLRWSAPIVHTIRELRQAALPAVFFGGTLRSLLLARLAPTPKFGRPRDLDIVVSGTTLDALRARMQQHVIRETRFGGLQLVRNSWHFDVWPLERTWALAHDASLEARFDALPHTTFLNLEAVAVEVWPGASGTRAMFSGDDQFFRGVLERTIEVNREDNPFPALCVVRALVLANTTQFAIGPRLADFLSRHRNMVSNAELEVIQRQHYGAVRVVAGQMRRWLEFIANVQREGGDSAIHLAFPRQLTFWEDAAEKALSVNLHLLSDT